MCVDFTFFSDTLLVWGSIQTTNQATLNNPDLLLTELFPTGEEQVASYLVKELNISVKSVSRLRRSWMSPFRLPLHRVQAVVSYLVDLLSAGGLGTNECKRIVGRIVLAQPKMMYASVETNLEPCINFLRASCELDDKDIARVVTRCPTMLQISMEALVQPRLEFFANLLRREDESTNVQELLRKCIWRRSPDVLTRSIENVASKVEYYNSLGSTTTGVPLASRIAFRNANVLKLHVADNVAPKLEFLSKVWGVSFPSTGETTDPSRDGDDHALLSHLVGDYPNVLALSLEKNLQPTMEFYNQTGYTELGDDWTLQEGSRAILGNCMESSLSNRLLPRWHYFHQQREQGKEGEAQAHSLDIKPSLSALNRATDRSFCEMFGFDVQDYTKFRLEYAPN